MKNLNTYFSAAIAFVVCFGIPALGLASAVPAQLDSYVAPVVEEKVEAKASVEKKAPVENIKKTKDEKPSQDSSNSLDSNSSTASSIKEEGKDEQEESARQESEPATGEKNEPVSVPAKEQEAAEEPQQAAQNQPAQPRAQTHTHNWTTRWVPKTTQKWVVDKAAWDETVWVPKTEEVWVVDSEGYTELVHTGSYLQCSCGATFSTAAEHTEHIIPILLETGIGHAGWLESKYEEIYHEATGHYETVDNGYNETIHHDEVGHYETVDNGYNETYCTTCGAIQ